MSKYCGAKTTYSNYCYNPIKKTDNRCYAHREADLTAAKIAFAEKRSETYRVESGQVAIRAEVFADGKVVVLPQHGNVFQFNKGSDPELVKDVANALLAAAGLAGKFNG